MSRVRLRLPLLAALLVCAVVASLLIVEHGSSTATVIMRSESYRKRSGEPCIQTVAPVAGDLELLRCTGIPKRLGLGGSQFLRFDAVFRKIPSQRFASLLIQFPSGVFESDGNRIEFRQRCQSQTSLEQTQSDPDRETQRHQCCGEEDSDQTGAKPVHLF